MMVKNSMSAKKKLVLQLDGTRGHFILVIISIKHFNKIENIFEIK